MILLLIVILWIISLSLRLMCSGINSLRKVNDRVITLTDNIGQDFSKSESNKKGSDSDGIGEVQKKPKSLKKKGSEYAKRVNTVLSKVSIKTLRAVRWVVDFIKHLLTLLLPLVFVLDIVVLIFAIVVSSSVVLLYDDILNNTMGTSGNGSVLLDGSDSTDDSTNINSIGNATLAEAAVDLAGTCDVAIPFDQHGVDAPNLQKPELALYKEKHIEYFGTGDIYFASCDRGVATAVRYSGVDSNFPPGAVANIYSYLNDAESGALKWKCVGRDDGSTELKPGDILILDGKHIFMYVGNEAVRKKFPDSSADYYSASYEDYYPYVYDGGPNNYYGQYYEVYRYIN